MEKEGGMFLFREVVGGVQGSGEEGQGLSLILLFRCRRIARVRRRRALDVDKMTSIIIDPVNATQTPVSSYHNYSN